MAFWFRRRNPDRELDEEFATHLSLETERQMRRGLSPAAARDAAQRVFGNAGRYREQVHELREMLWIERLNLDVRYALRTLARRKVATAGAIIALALGFGVPTAAVTVLVARWTAVFPQIKEPNRLVTLWETPPGEPGTRRAASEDTWRVWQSHPDFFAGISAAQPPLLISLRMDGIPENVRVQALAPSLLSLFEVSPQRGRGFVASDTAPGAPPVVMLSHSFWQARLAGQESVLGTTLDLDGQPHAVIGVMARGFWFHDRDVDFWVPSIATASPTNRFNVVARLKPGDTREALAARLAALAPQVDSANPGREPGWGISLRGMGLRTLPFEELPPGVIMLIAATVLALIVACANVAMVMVARGSTRQRETAVRSALGAPRTRLIRQFLTESTLVSLAGGALALFFVYGVAQLIAANVPIDEGIPSNFGRDWRVIGSVMAVALLVGIAAGLAPALTDSRVNLVAALKETGYFSVTFGRARLRKGLIVFEVALTVMLLACVSLLVRGARELETTGPGFDSRNLFRARVSPVQHVGRPPSASVDQREMLSRIRAARGVQSASIGPTAFDWDPPRSVRVGASSGNANAELTRVPVAEVTADYFDTLGLGILEGRGFEPDLSIQHDTVVVSQAFARRSWPGRNAIGQVLRIDDQDERQVIGVVSDVLVGPGQGRRAPNVVIYVHRPWPKVPAENGPFGVLVRTSDERAEALRNVRKAAADVNPLQALTIGSVDEILAVGAAEQRFAVYLAGPLMLLALLLTVSGIYGLLAQTIVQKSHELAIRVMLGARRRQLIQLIGADGLALAGLGAIVGIVAAVALDRVLGAFLLDLPGEEPVALAASGLTIMAVTAVVSLAPCRRVFRIDPARTLKYE